MRVLALGTAAALWAGGVGAVAAKDDSSATIPGCHHDDNTGGTLAANPQVPCDFTVKQSSDALAEHYRFAWNTFFAINWPAQQPDQLRGVPDQSKSFTDAGTPVWDTWKEKRQLYRVKALAGGNIWSTTDPGPFQTPPTGHDPNRSIKMCSGESAPSGQMRTVQSSKIDNFADETDEIGLVVLWDKATPYPTDKSLIRYQVKFNADYWNYVRSNGFYATHTLNQFIAQTASKSAPVGKVAFPMSSTGTDINGAIMLKTGWRLLDSDADASKYYAVDMLYYDKEDGSTCFRTGQFGLIAIHVVRKTETFPYFLYSTFEHKENYPGVYAYANTNITNNAAVPDDLQPKSCTDVSVPKSGTLKSAILPNGCGIEYTDPKHPIVGVTPAGVPQYEADRLIPPRDQLNQVNQAADSVTQGSVWNNYRLVGVQTLPVDGKTKDENPAADQDYYLANPVVETSQRFQYFTGDFSAPRVVNVYKNHDDDSRVMMGGCMGCHGAGAQGASHTLNELMPNSQFLGGSGGTDFSFTLQNIRNNPSEPTGAESIEDVCGEINLIYDETARACMPPS
jgi:hypothetical protein